MDFGHGFYNEIKTKLKTIDNIDELLSDYVIYGKTGVIIFNQSSCKMISEKLGINYHKLNRFQKKFFKSALISYYTGDDLF